MRQVLHAAPALAVPRAGPAPLLLCAGMFPAAGVGPLTAYAEKLHGACGSRLEVTETFTHATLLILTGLAAAVAFRARLWNIGGAGQLSKRALVTAGLGHSMKCGLPAILKARLQAGPGRCIPAFSPSPCPGRPSPLMSYSCPATGHVRFLQAVWMPQTGTF